MKRNTKKILAKQAMSANPLSHDATASTRGTIFHLLVTLHECFKMTAQQRVIIECLGDLTVEGCKQIEVKHYHDFLTDSHVNVWKTLKNWMNDDFDVMPYSALILYTTQLCGKKSSWQVWNDLALNQRLEILEKIYLDTEEREKQRLETKMKEKNGKGKQALQENSTKVPDVNDIKANVTETIDSLKRNGDSQDTIVTNSVDNNGVGTIGVATRSGAANSSSVNSITPSESSPRHAALDQVPEVLALQRIVMNPANRKKLEAIVERFVIDYGALGMEETYEKIKQVYCKGVLEAKCDDFLNSLFGFILSPGHQNKTSWDVTYAQFKSRVECLTSQYCKGTTQFPTKFRRSSSRTLESEAQALVHKLFVGKIHAIEYDDVISNAMRDYLYANDTVLQELSDYEVPPNHFNMFADEVLQHFQSQYRKAAREMKDMIKDSQSFYDEMMTLHVPNFAGFETPSSSFRNGVIHMHCDDEAKNLQWRLRDS